MSSTPVSVTGLVRALKELKAPTQAVRAVIKAVAFKSSLELPEIEGLLKSCDVSDDIAANAVFNAREEEDAPVAPTPTSAMSNVSSVVAQSFLRPEATGWITVTLEPLKQDRICNPISIESERA